eukprot:CAMPEP_0181296836 /NCGR_PEP_ID=MMETSP1101-20121128/4915_1 /TAXON_ID=46948 /ORGANISM="Rhodomonas abbreviata, Strain Caron Lab Isolate" /LENGTH=364 /DNA_ID=CAMNT_0023401725 /DNA_START=109 /DNA_END=1203 /DNA_ORIENTATION=-
MFMAKQERKLSPAILMTLRYGEGEVQKRADPGTNGGTNTARGTQPSPPAVLKSRRALIEQAALAVPLILMGNPDPSSGLEGGGELVLLLGATGGIGQYISRQLLAQGYRVRGVSRYPSEARKVLGEEVEWVAADLNDPSKLAPVMQGVSKVIFAAGAHGWEDIGNNRRIYGEAVGELARLSAAQGVSRFVLVSSGGLTIENAGYSPYLKDVLFWKLRGENLLRESGTPYTIVRAYSLDNAAEKSKPQGKSKGESASSTAGSPTPPPEPTMELLLFQGDKAGVGGLISRHDLAAVAVAAMQLPAPPDARKPAGHKAAGVTFEVLARDKQMVACPAGTGRGMCVGRASDDEADDWRAVLRELKLDT